MGVSKMVVYNRNSHLCMDDLGVPLFQETTIYIYIVIVLPHIFFSLCVDNVVFGAGQHHFTATKP